MHTSGIIDRIMERRSGSSSSDDDDDDCRPPSTKRLKGISTNDFSHLPYLNTMIQMCRHNYAPYKDDDEWTGRMKLLNRRFVNDSDSDISLEEPESEPPVVSTSGQVLPPAEVTPAKSETEKVMTISCTLL